MGSAMQDEGSAKAGADSEAAAWLRRQRRAGSAGRLNAVLGLLSVPLFAGVWELVARSGAVNVVLFPPPSVVIVALFEWVRSGQFFGDLLASLYRVSIGFV